MKVPKDVPFMSEKSSAPEDDPASGIGAAVDPDGTSTDMSATRSESLSAIVEEDSSPPSSSIAESPPDELALSGLSRSARRAKWIRSISEHEDHRGQLLA